MLTLPWKPVTHAIGACVWVLVVACSGTDHGAAAQPPAVRPKVANPAARKCLDDGYELEAVSDADGVPIDHQCVDKLTGKSCEVWDYFRGRCRLREAPR